MFINYLAFILWLLMPFNPPQLIINPSRITIKALSSFKLVTDFGCIWTNNVLRCSIIKKSSLFAIVPILFLNILMTMVVITISLPCQTSIISFMSIISSYMSHLLWKRKFKSSTQQIISIHQWTCTPTTLVINELLPILLNAKVTIPLRTNHYPKLFLKRTSCILLRKWSHSLLKHGGTNMPHFHVIIN